MKIKVDLLLGLIIIGIVASHFLGMGWGIAIAFAVLMVK